MSERRKVAVSVFDQEQYDGDWPNGTVQDVIAWFQSKLDLIPEEYRAAAKCEIDSASGYEGSHYGHIRISYLRDETDEEMAERETRAQAELEAQLRHAEARAAALRERLGKSG